jgi:hypothetical protein
MSITSGSITELPEFVKATINKYALDTRPGLYYLIIPSLYSAFLVPLLVALFLFSTPELRRSLIFISVVADVVCVIFMGGVSLYAEVSSYRLYVNIEVPLTLAKFHVLTNPFDSDRLATTPLERAYYFFTAFMPWIIDFLLFLRLIAVYPLRMHSRLTIAGVFVFPVAIKVARIVPASLSLKEMYSASAHGFQPVLNIPWTSPWPRVEWFLQIFDIRYAVLI